MEIVTNELTMTERFEKKVTYIVKTKGIRFFSREDVEKYGFQVIGFK